MALETNAPSVPRMLIFQLLKNMCPKGIALNSTGKASRVQGSGNSLGGYSKSWASVLNAPKTIHKNGTAVTASMTHRPPYARVFPRIFRNVT